jgi:hypothetical protein
LAARPDSFLIQIDTIVAARRGTIKRFALRALHGALQQKTVDIHRLTMLVAAAKTATGDMRSPRKRTVLFRIARWCA